MSASRARPFRYACLAVLAACSSDSAPGLAATTSSGPSEEGSRDRVLALDTNGCKVRLLVPIGGDFTASDAQLLAWVERGASAVAGWYGQFPVPTLTVDIAAEETAAVGNAVTRPHGDSVRILVGLGVRVRERELRNDWVLVHEMIHTALPSLPEEQRWLEEGLATYLEGVVRCRAGLRPPRGFWSEFVRNAPAGLPAAGGAGLDGTSDWGRTYWGGALFCLLLDLEIRERTGGKRSLQDAVRAILAAGGDLRVEWKLERVLAVMDTAIGIPIASEMHARHGAKSSPIDLDSLWRSLGVVARGTSVVLEDSAPRAKLRRAITSG